MSAFRDEREALLARLEQLEQELAGVREADKREAILRELSTLANRVEVATRRVEEDERALGEIGRSIDRIRKSIDGGAPDEQANRPATEATTNTLPAQRSLMVYSVVALVLIAVVAISYVTSSRQRGVGIDLTAPASSIAGFPHAVDPSALVSMARARTRWGKDARLTGIRVEYAQSNGLVDLRASTYEARIAYSFIGPPEPPPQPVASAPLGAPSPARPPTSVTTVTVTSTGMSVEPFNLSLSDDAIADPTCSIADVWSAARARGAPPDAIAVFEYGPKNVFEAGHFHTVTRWHFSIRGSTFDDDFADPGCQLLETKTKLF